MKKKWVKIAHPWFVSAILLAFIHQLLQKGLSINIAVLDNYLDPLLLMPILLHLLLWEKRILFRNGDHYTLTKIQLIYYFVIITIVCEVFFPRWNPMFTADIYDVVCYAVGTIYYDLLHNKPYIYNRYSSLGSAGTHLG